MMQSIGPATATAADWTLMERAWFTTPILISSSWTAVSRSFAQADRCSAAWWPCRRPARRPAAAPSDGARLSVEQRARSVISLEIPQRHPVQHRHRPRFLRPPVLVPERLRPPGVRNAHSPVSGLPAIKGLLADPAPGANASAVAPPTSRSRSTPMSCASANLFVSMSVSSRPTGSHSNRGIRKMAGHRSRRNWAALAP